MTFLRNSMEEAAEAIELGTKIYAKTKNASKARKAMEERTNLYIDSAWR